jgi:hypothetical protein
MVWMQWRPALRLVSIAWLKLSTFSNSVLYCHAVQGKSDASNSAASTPPPPPTVAPKPAPERKPKLRSAYRRQKQSTEERKQQLQEQHAEQQQVRAGHEEVLSPEAMAAKAAAVQADRTTSQKWLRHVVKPLTDLMPVLLAHQNFSSRGGVQATSVPTILVIDGYNLLHQHSSTKQLIAQDQMHQAQHRLHTLLREYTQQQQGLYALVVYDAHSVSRTSSSTRQQLSSKVTAIYEAGQEADSVIISLAETLLNREAAAAAQGHLGLFTPSFCSLVVHTNDNRIKTAVTDAAVAAAKRKHKHVVLVQISSSTQLSAELQLLENKLFNRQQQQWAGSAGPASSRTTPMGQLPDPQQDTEAWARAYLALSGASSSSSWESDSDDEAGGSSDGSSSKRRRRRLTQQQQLDVEARELAARLSDEQLLQLSAAGGVVVAGAAAVSSADDDWSVSSPLEAAAVDAAGQPPAAAAARGAEGARTPGSSASQQLDELLNLDLDRFLDDL